MFQGLGQKGQRTRCNAGVPSTYNNYLHLRVNLKDYPKMVIAYKRRELVHNERYQELQTYNTSLLLKDSQIKQDTKTQRKKSRQDYILTQKNHDKRP